MRQIQHLDRDTAQALGVAVAARLGVDPNQVTAEGFTAEYVSGTSPVVVRWESVATVPVDEWNALVADAAASLEPPT